MADDKFDKLKSTFTKSVATINVKTSVFFETAKLKTHISTLQTEIKDLKCKIGDKTFELWSLDRFDLSEIVQECTLISEKLKSIETLKQEIFNLENQQMEVFGNKANNVEVIAKSEFEFVCSNCKTIYTSPVKFCRKCGSKMV